MKAAIFTSTYNKKYYTMAALYSLLHQNVDFEYAVYIRENSTDKETVDVIQKFHDPKLHIEYRTDDDPVGGFNWFYREAPADYLFCSHDDIILHPDFLGKMCSVMDEGKDVYCAMQFVRFNRSVEYYSEKPTIYLPSDPPETLHGAMELLQMGIRKESIEKIRHPLFTPYNISEGRKISCDTNMEAMDKLQKVCQLYPVIKDGKTDVLITHITTEYALWNNYDIKKGGE